MESSIKIDFRDTGKGLEPIIAIKLISSEDPRDKLLQAFFQSLGGQSSWLSVSFDHHIVTEIKSAKTFITLHPIREDELTETVNIIKSRISGEVIADNPSNYNPLKDRYVTS